MLTAPFALVIATPNYLQSLLSCLIFIWLDAKRSGPSILGKDCLSVYGWRYF